MPSSRVLRQRVSAAVQEPPVSKKELRKPRSENTGAEKGFFVDHTCIGRLIASTSASPYKHLQGCVVIVADKYYQAGAQDLQCRQLMAL